MQRVIVRELGRVVPEKALAAHDSDFEEQRDVFARLDALRDDVAADAARGGDQPAQVASPARVLRDAADQLASNLHDIRLQNHDRLEGASAEPDMIEREADPERTE